MFVRTSQISHESCPTIPYLQPTTPIHTHAHGTAWSASSLACRAAGQPVSGYDFIGEGTCQTAQGTTLPNWYYSIEYRYTGDNEDIFVRSRLLRKETLAALAEQASRRGDWCSRQCIASPGCVGFAQNPTAYHTNCLLYGTINTRGLNPITAENDWSGVDHPDVSSVPYVANPKNKNYGWWSYSDGDCGKGTGTGPITQVGQHVTLHDVHAPYLPDCVYPRARDSARRTEMCRSSVYVLF